MSDEFPLPEPPSRNSNVYAVELVSGSFGGAAQVIVGQPLDTLKTVDSYHGFR
jgi:solute carrier family 25 carnitine/acylcarnitine transporter 20/29